jgi:hypothetical protein
LVAVFQVSPRAGAEGSDLKQVRPYGHLPLLPRV